MTQQDLIDMILALPAGTHMVLTRDQRGDGYDIAVAPHVDDLSAIQEAIPGGWIARGMHACGALCAYQIVVPDQDEQLRLCQHSGTWGPWYHVSRYVRSTSGKWVFAERLGGHYSSARAATLGLQYGRP